MLTPNVSSHRFRKTPAEATGPDHTRLSVTSIDSRQLLPPGQSTLVIEHGDQRYQLRVTRENKLILTK